jgi:hypothetical protein
MVALDGSASFDPDGDPITYLWTLAERPEGSSAMLSTSTDPRTALRTDVAGRYRVRLTVHDGLQRSPEAELVVLAIAADVDPPTLRLSLSPPGLTLGASSRICVTATDASPLRARALTVGGAAIPLDGAGCATFAPTAAGRYEVVATARDSADNLGTARGAVYVASLADDGAPRLTVTGARWTEQCSRRRWTWSGP